MRGVREMHGKYPWLNLLGGTVISAQEGVAKPDPRIYDIAIGRFHNFTVRGVREMHGKYPWLNLLGGTVISAQEGVAKPDPRIYDIAIGRFHLDPAQTLFVDDNACNVLAARAAGPAGRAFRERGADPRTYARLVFS